MLPAALLSSHHFFNSLPISPLSVVIGLFLRSSSLGPSPRAKDHRTAVVRINVPSTLAIISPSVHSSRQQVIVRRPGRQDKVFRRELFGASFFLAKLERRPLPRRSQAAQ